MIVTKKRLSFFLTIAFIIIIILIGFIIYFYNSNNKLVQGYHNNSIDLRLNDIDSLIQRQHQDLVDKYSKSDSNSDKICMTQSQFENLTKKNNPYVTKNDTIVRDYRVIKDDLFPPINRTDTVNHTNLTNNILNRSMYINTNNVNDTFRLVGYVTCNDIKKDTGNNSWKLFGRQKDRHFSEFYITPTNNNNDVKIFLSDDIIVGDRIRDMYAIPNTINFKSPLLNETPYQVVEIPKQDISYNSLNYM
jgi:hypothetical protein